MITPPSLDATKRAIRCEICVRCPRRTANVNDPDTPLPCEASCVLFRELPRIATLVRYRDPMLYSTGQIVRESLRAPGRPLRWYTGRLTSILDRMRARRTPRSVIPPRGIPYGGE
jgi:hypothetical protein